MQDACGAVIRKLSKLSVLKVLDRAVPIRSNRGRMLKTVSFVTSYWHEVCAASSMAQPSPATGVVIAHYRVVKKLGGGGMGVVY
jgi:hypothetical protein